MAAKEHKGSEGAMVVKEQKWSKRHSGCQGPKMLTGHNSYQRAKKVYSDSPDSYWRTKNTERVQ